jgi:hypothetical protein
MHSYDNVATFATPRSDAINKADDRRRFRNGCCSCRALCPAHRFIAIKYRLQRRRANERAGLKPYSFEDKRANELIALARDLHGPTLPDTAEARDMVFKIANYMTGEPERLKDWIAGAADWYFEDDADRLLGRLAHKPYRFRSSTLAKAFDVTQERKDRIGGIKTIRALDAPADVIKAAEERKRKRKLAYDLRYQQAKRLRLGMKSRAEYRESFADSARHTEPWKTLGMSRTDWYRKGKPTPESFGTRSVVVDLSITGNDSPSPKRKPRRCALPSTPSLKPEAKRKPPASHFADATPSHAEAGRRRKPSATMLKPRSLLKRRRSRLGPASFKVEKVEPIHMHHASGSTPRGGVQALRSTDPIQMEAVR